MTQPNHLAPFGDWEKTASAADSGDPLWSVQAYRIALYVIECHTFDRRSNSNFARAASIDQLTRALGSIAANIAEGYSRASAADRVRFYGYALGSTREATTWYKNVRLELGPIVEDRNALLIQIRRLLLTTLRNSRAKDPTSMLRDSHRND